MTGKVFLLKAPSDSDCCFNRTSYGHLDPASQDKLEELYENALVVAKDCPAHQKAPVIAYSRTINPKTLAWAEGRLNDRFPGKKLHRSSLSIAGDEQRYTIYVPNSQSQSQRQSTQFLPTGALAQTFVNS